MGHGVLLSALSLRHLVEIVALSLAFLTNDGLILVARLQFWLLGS